MEAYLGTVLMRTLHILFGILWIGLLYYFNFVQTEYFKESEADAKSDVVKKLNTKHADFSYRIDQQKFGRIIIVCARVRLSTDDKSSTKQWFAYKEIQAGVMSWELA